MFYLAVGFFYTLDVCYGCLNMWNYRTKERKNKQGAELWKVKTISVCPVTVLLLSIIRFLPKYFHCFKDALVGEKVNYTCSHPSVSLLRSLHIVSGCLLHLIKGVNGRCQKYFHIKPFLKNHMSTKLHQNILLYLCIISVYVQRWLGSFFLDQQ